MSPRTGSWPAAWWLCLAVGMGLVLTGAAGTATAGADREAAEGGVFEPGKVWQFHLTIAAREHEAMQPRGGRGFLGFGGPPRPMPTEKPEEPAREVHRNAFGMDLPWATGSVMVGDQTFKDVGIRYK